LTPPKTPVPLAVTEIVGALAPLLQDIVRKEDLRALARQEDIQELTAEFRTLNGTVRDLTVWQGVVNERHRQESEARAEAKAAPEPASPLPLLTFVLTWILRFMLATAAIMGAVNLPKLAELLK